MSQRMNRISRIAVIICATCITGCAAPSDFGSGVTQEKGRRDRSAEWKKWEYPNNTGRSITNGKPGTLVLYQASTKDRFADVLKHYEEVSGIDGLGDPQSAGQWTAESAGEEEKVRAFQASAGFSHHPSDRMPNDRSFIVRMPDYAVTAFIRQEPPDGDTRITLIFETK